MHLLSYSRQHGKVCTGNTDFSNTLSDVKWKAEQQSGEQVTCTNNKRDGWQWLRRPAKLSGWEIYILKNSGMEAI